MRTCCLRRINLVRHPVLPRLVAWSPLLLLLLLLGCASSSQRADPLMGEQPAAAAHGLAPLPATTNAGLAIGNSAARGTADLPALDPVSRRDSAVARGVMGSSRVASYEQAQALLAARGVKWQRLETWGDRGEWKFSCSIPNPHNPYISRTFEARAGDYLSAVRAVIDQMERE
jgi:hypothetical protein